MTAQTSNSAPVFEDDEVKSFREDDTEAASAIGKMLVAFFFYSLLAMAFVTWWSLKATTPDTPTEATGTHAH